MPPHLCSMVQMSHPFPTLSTAHWNKRTGLESLAPLPWKSLKCGKRVPIASLSVSPCSGQYLLCSSPDTTTSLSLYDLHQRAHDHRPISPLKMKKSRASIPITGEATNEMISVVKWWPVDAGLFTTLSHHRLYVWDANRFQSDFEFKFDLPSYCQEYSQLAKHHLFVAVGTYDGIRLCDLRSGSQAQVLREAGCDNRVGCLVWSPFQEHCLYSGGHDPSVRSASTLQPSRGKKRNNEKSVLKVWDIRRQGPLATFDSAKDAKPSPIASLAFSRDGLSLMTMDEKGELELWDPQSRLAVNAQSDRKVQWREALPKASVAPLKNGSFAVPNLNRIQIWDYEPASKSLLEKQELVEHWDQVIALDYNEHLEELISAGKDNQLIVWGLGK